MCTHKLGNRDADKEAGAERYHGEQAKIISDAAITPPNTAPESGASPGPRHSELSRINHKLKRDVSNIM